MITNAYFNHTLAAPLYFTTLHGDDGVERTKGANVAFLQTRKGFRVYVTSTKEITPAYAEVQLLFATNSQ